MRRIRLVIAEARTLYRDALAALFAGAADVEVVGTAGDLDELRMIGRHTVPDVAVAAMEMLGVTGAALLRADWPKVVLIAIGEGGRNGADLRVSVAESGVELVRSVRGVVCADPNETHEPHLTDRERTIVELVADGLSNKEIAHRLGIGAQTVKNHVSHLLDKLGFVDRTQLAVYAVERHLARRHPEDSANA